jgi:hypothetical protein
MGACRRSPMALAGTALYLIEKGLVFQAALVSTEQAIVDFGSALLLLLIAGEKDGRAPPSAGSVNVRVRGVHSKFCPARSRWTPALSAPARGAVL